MPLNDDQLMISEAAQRFAYDKLRPFAGEWDEHKHFPVDVMREAAGLGFAAIYTGEAHGGAGMSRLDAVLIFEQLSRGCIATAAFLSIHNMCIWMIDSFGSEALRARFVPPLTSMVTIASYCLTEPGSGSDAAAMKTRAVKDGDAYVLNGSKAFISGAGVSDIYAVMAKTGETISAFVVPKETPGLSFGANEKKMGWNAQPTRQVMFDQVRISVENRIGDEGQGFKFAMKGLDGGRLNIAACSLGGAQDALDRATQYASERSQFGKHLNEFQAMQFKLADMETELQAARSMLYEAAARLDASAPDATKWCAMAKRFVTDTCSKIANNALQIHGGYGYLHDYGVERIVRDLRVHQILEGTNEIMRVIIARDMLKRFVMDVSIRVENGIGRITLNRPKALHALTTEMCQVMTDALTAWQDVPSVRAIMIDHAEGTRGFCAGGDIRRVAQSGRADGKAADEFFRIEYSLNNQIKHYPKPYIALMDGITMGGGVGISVHGSHRIATENTLFAMPETGIGLFPDVGGGWFLPRLEGELGTWLALTGARLKGADVVAAGIATHLIASENLPNVKARILAGEALDDVLKDYTQVPVKPGYVEYLDIINHCFPRPTITDICLALKMADDDWATAQADILKSRSPLSLSVSLEQLRRGARMTSFEDVMRMEYRIACHIIRSHDFSEGVRAVIEDKDNAPTWSPTTLSGVTPQMVEAIFASVDEELAL